MRINFLIKKFVNLEFFFEYRGFQPKITPAQTYAVQCISMKICTAKLLTSSEEDGDFPSPYLHDMQTAISALVRKGKSRGL